VKHSESIKKDKQVQFLHQKILVNKEIFYTMSKTIGILGGGQLARMLALAAHPLGIRTRCIDPSPDCPAAQVTECGCFAFDDVEGISRYFSGIDVLTFEFENVPVETVKALAGQYEVRPSEYALEVTQNRIREKEFCKGIGVPVPGFVSAESMTALLAKPEALFFPSVLKRTTGGYDGKGQWRLDSIDDLVALSSSSKSFEVIMEEFVPFDAEYSCIGVRSRDGDMAFYSICENVHVKGILFETVSPPEHDTEGMCDILCSYTRKIADELNYVGVIAVEYFQKDKKFYFNEFAPRVHNTGHWTIEGAATSQFENHIRACAGLPLGSTSSIGHSLMYNLLGTKGDVDALMSCASLHYHWYGKSVITDRRKVGHVTQMFSSHDQLEALRNRLGALVT
jgi:5-(carboxyamino)imidazole ribonucleotide synthase